MTLPARILICAAVWGSSAHAGDDNETPSPSQAPAESGDEQTPVESPPEAGATAPPGDNAAAGQADTEQAADALPPALDASSEPALPTPEAPPNKAEEVAPPPPPDIVGSIFPVQYTRCENETNSRISASARLPSVASSAARETKSSW